MKMLVIEKSTGEVLGSGSNLIRVIENALLRGANQDDLVFVYGEPDVELFKFANRVIQQISWLPQYLEKKCAMDFLVHKAQCQLGVWQRIKNTRMVESPDSYSMSLEECCTVSLALDIRLLLNIDGRRDCRILAPDIKRTFKDAHAEAAKIARRCPVGFKIVLAIHEELGVIVVMPENFLPENSGFAVRSTYGGLV